ncbi:MAG: putative baseplate assembly protein [Nannocystaceae bacterium]
MPSDDRRTPKIDPRGADEVAAEAEVMIEALLGGAWTPAPAGALDPLGALTRIFGDMAARAIDAVNAVPDAAFDAFLELLGVRPEPPAPARVPLTFKLVDDAPADALIPAGTQIGATADVDDASSDEIIFETERELVVHRARVAASFVHRPATDHLDETTATVVGAAPGARVLFDPATRGVHELYISCRAALERAGVTSVVVRMNLKEAHTSEDVTLRWAAWDGLGWRDLEADAAIVTEEGATIYRATLADLPALPLRELHGHEQAWLRARLDVEPHVSGAASSGADRVRAFGEIRGVTMDAVSAGGGVEAVVGEPGEWRGTPSARALRGATKLDPTLDMRPFGELPSVGASFAIDGGEALAQPAGTQVWIRTTNALGAGTPAASADLVLVWEVRDADGGWTEIGRSDRDGEAIAGENTYSFVDGSKSLTVDGVVEFRLPATVPEAKIAGQKGRWLRIRLARGSYGAPERVAYDAQTETWGMAPSTLAPPLIECPRLAYKHVTAGLGAWPVLRANLGCVRDITEALASGWVAPFEVIPAEMPGAASEPTLYLGFDRAFAPRPVDLFALIHPPDPRDTQPPEGMPSPVDRPRLAWEYRGASGWLRLGVRDGSDSLRERGLIRFIGPEAMAPAALFGREGYWLRARWVAGAYRSLPKVGRILSGSTWAVHAFTRRGELLGSATGAPGLRLQTVAAPVLQGERLEIRERADARTYDLEALRAEVGDEQLTIERGADEAITAVWVRWLPVAHFDASGASDRVYVLDAATGVITFGDGRHGMIPPKGDANVRMAVYRTGGGPRGNRPVGAVNALKTTLRFVDSVTNHAAASGGTQAEAAERVRARGPRLLRHRDRAVTVDDYRDLALASAQEVVRAYVMTSKYNPIDMVVDLAALDAEAEGAPQTDADGWVVLEGIPEDTAAVAENAADVRVIIVPDDDASQPVPSLGLIERVESYLRERSAPSARLAVSGPRWIKVAVRVDLVPEPDAPADTLSATVLAAITRFLHPLTGGEAGEGWAFGRVPRRSHLYRLISAIEGVSHVRDVALITDPELPADAEALDPELRRALAGALIYSGDHAIVLTVPVEEVD